jgi:hypothetical protein
VARGNFIILPVATLWQEVFLSFQPLSFCGKREFHLFTRCHVAAGSIFIFLAFAMLWQEGISSFNPLPRCGKR